MVGPLLGAQLRPRGLPRHSHVIAVPGFGSDDRYLAPLRHYLRRHGYTVEGWGLGKNLAGIDLPHTLDDLDETWEFSPKSDYRGEGSVPYLCDRLKERIRAVHEAGGRPVSLVGWSLGGYLAREAARDLPGIVDRVITLGSPTVGGPKYTAAAPFFRKRGMDLDWIEREIRGRESRPIRQPITAIYSKSDAVVSWRAAIDHHSDDVTHIEVDAAHLGMGFNPTIWRLITRALEADVRREVG
jgi:pimeloyl-ACP methyl ester carboxylesterase